MATYTRKTDDTITARMVPRTNVPISLSSERKVKRLKDGVNSTAVTQIADIVQHLKQNVVKM